LDVNDRKNLRYVVLRSSSVGASIPHPLSPVSS
jgi:hypothetical protein